MADIEELQLVNDYKGSLDDVVKIGWDEIHKGFMPELMPLKTDLTEYDTVILATPVWHLHYAPAMKSFLKQDDLSGKKLYIIATNAGWLGDTVTDIRNDTKGAKYVDYLNIVYDDKKLNWMKTSEKEIRRWLEKIKI